VVRLRGYIDRVDIGDGSAFVTDYKTGTAYDEKEFLADPVVAGTKVQLAVYSNAVRRHLEAAGRPVGQVTASYWFISEKGHFERIAVTDGVESNARLAQVMEVVNEGLTVGAFPQVPGEEGYMPGRFGGKGEPHRHPAIGRKVQIRVLAGGVDPCLRGRAIPCREAVGLADILKAPARRAGDFWVWRDDLDERHDVS